MSETENKGIDWEGENFPSWKPMTKEEKEFLESIRASQEELDQRRKEYQKWKSEK